MIRTITEKAWAMMIDFQAPIQFWGEAVNSTVYLQQRSPNEGQKRSNHDGYQAPYEMSYEMLDGFGIPLYDINGNKILFYPSLPNRRRIGCYGSRLILEVLCRGIFGMRLKPCMMVGYTYDPKTLWRI